MGNAKELPPAQVVAAARAALAPHGRSVVDLTPEFLKRGGDCLDCLDGHAEKARRVYVLPNCKAVRKKMGRDGVSMAKGSPRQKFEERSVDGGRSLFAVFALRKGKVLSGYMLPSDSLAVSCEALRVLFGEEVPCAICLAPLVRKTGSMRWPCGHWLHATCFEKWSDTKLREGADVSCPTCRATLVPH